MYLSFSFLLQRKLLRENTEAVSVSLSIEVNVCLLYDF